jgi:hypothetical protein
MPLQTADSIDIVCQPFPGDTCKLLLFITDDGSVSDELQRYQLLTAKLTTYIRYIVSQEFREKYPDIGPQDVIVRVICERPPNQAMTEIQSVAPRGEGGDTTKRIRVQFFEQKEFKRRLTAGWDKLTQDNGTE